MWKRAQSVGFHGPCHDNPRKRADKFAVGQKWPQTGDLRNQFADFAIWWVGIGEFVEGAAKVVRDVHLHMGVA